MKKPFYYKKNYRIYYKNYAPTDAIAFLSGRKLIKIEEISLSNSSQKLIITSCMVKNIGMIWQQSIKNP